MFPSSARQATTKLPDSPRIREVKRLYPPKKVWPPDFKTLSRGEQFRLEKKYKRRINLAMARPRWNAGVRLAQLFTCTGTYGCLSWWSRSLQLTNSTCPGAVVYGALFMDNHKGEEQPFNGVRLFRREHSMVYRITGLTINQFRTVFWSAMGYDYISRSSVRKTDVSNIQ